QRPRRAADRPRAALERYLGLLVAKEIQNQLRNRARFCGVVWRQHGESRRRSERAELHRQWRVPGYHDCTLTPPGRRRLRVRFAIVTARVVVEAPAALAPQPPRRDQARRDRRRPPPWLPVTLLVEGALDEQSGIEPNEIRQLKRPHAKPAPQSADAVDLLHRRHPLDQQSGGF